MVVQQAGEDRFAAAGTTADLVSGLEHGDRTPSAAKADGGGEPVRSAAHHQCGTHASAP